MTEQLAAIFRDSISELEPAEPICLEVGTAVAKVMELMRDKRIGCVLVTRDGVLAGIFSERDVIVKIVGQQLDADAPIDAYMTPNPESLGVNHAIAFALNRMSLGGYRHVPLVDAQQKPVGVVSVKDVVDYLVEHFAQGVYNLPPEPGVVPSSAEGA